MKMYFWKKKIFKNNTRIMWKIIFYFSWFKQKVSSINHDITEREQYLGEQIFTNSKWQEDDKNHN